MPGSFPTSANFWQAFSCFCAGFLAGSHTRLIEAGVEGIEVFGIQLFLNGTECFTESLEVNDFPGAEKFNGIGNFRDVTDNAKDVVVGGAGLLFWGDLVSTTYTKI